jgi:transposase-like protein
VAGELVKYSEAFKQQVIEEIERGRFSSAYEAAEAYGVRGKGTIERWLRAPGRGGLLRKVVRVETPGEPGEVAAPQRHDQSGRLSGSGDDDRCGARRRHGPWRRGR